MGTQYVDTPQKKGSNIINLSKTNTIDRNHGYGIIKRKEAVHKYEGVFEQNCQDSYVITSVYLPK